MQQGYNDRLCQEYEHTRAICYYTYIVNVEAKDHIPIQKFWPLPSDPISSETLDADALTERFKRLRENEKIIKEKQDPFFNKQVYG